MRTFFFSLFAQIVELSTFFYSLKKNRIIFSSTNNCNFNFNSKYIFLFFLEKKSDIELYFVINDSEKRKVLIDQYGPHFISSNSLGGLIKIAMAKLWVVSDLKTPYLPILRNKRRKIFHMGHGVPLKNIIMAVENIPLLKYVNRFLRSRIITHVTAYSDSFIPVMEKTFKNKSIIYVPIGQPRNDALQCYTKKEQLDRIKKAYPDLPVHKQAILYAPTWRSYDTVKFFPFEDLTAEELNKRLRENDTVLFLRKHPYFPSLLDESYLKQSNIYLFDSALFPEVMDYLSYFDKLITDYSSIYLDFLCLNRPMAFIPYDLDKYIEHTGFTMPYETLTPGSYLNTKEDFFKFVIEVSDNLQDERARVAQLVNAKKAGNCEENYQFIQELLKK